MMRKAGKEKERMVTKVAGGKDPLALRLRKPATCVLVMRAVHTLTGVGFCMILKC